MKNIISTYGRSIEESVKNLDKLVEHEKACSLSSRSTDESERTLNGCYFINVVFESVRGTYLVIRRI